MSYKKLYVPGRFLPWFLHLQSTDRLSSGEVQALFGFKTPNCVAASVAKGFFPSPDITGTAKNQKVYWLKTTIVKEIARRRKVNRLYDQLDNLQLPNTK